jgi:hypothetical protein
MNFSVFDVLYVKGSDFMTPVISKFANDGGTRGAYCGRSGA